MILENRSANALPPLAFAALPLAERLVGEHPSPNTLGLALLAELGLGDPSVLLEMVLTSESGRATNIHAPGTHALEGVLLSEHVEVPQCEAGSELDVAGLWVRALSGETDGCRSLEVAKDGYTSLCIDSGGVHSSSVRGTTAAHAQELDLSHDKAVAAAMLAHNAVEMSKTLEVENLLGRRLAAHARVPVVVALDKTNHTTTSITKDGLLVIGGVAGNKLRLSAHARNLLDGAHDHVSVALSDLECGIDLVGVVVGANVLQSRLVLWLHVGPAWLG